MLTVHRREGPENVTSVLRPLLAVLLATSIAGSFPTGGSTTSLAPCGPRLWVRDAGALEPVEAYFRHRSYVPGELASLRIVRAPTGASVQIIHADMWYPASRRPDLVSGAPVGRPRKLESPAIDVRIGKWQSGLYFARISAGRKIGFAPFIVRAAAPARNAVAVVLPTYTWEAYNRFDQDHSGYGDTWYSDPRVDMVRFARPFLNRGVPPHLTPFPHWIWAHREPVDYLSDDDLNNVANAATLRHEYKLIVFPGHEEYVTRHMFDLITGYRNLGGNLAFLSANNFYSRVVRVRNGIRCVGHFRDEGKPEAALVGVQYVDWNHNLFPNRPYLVVGAERAPWFFRGTGLRDGEHFGFSYGIEIDALAPSSPRNITVLAELPNIFGPERTADMTYYVAPGGAKVFAAGAFNFDGSQSAVTDRLLLNLWNHLAPPHRKQKSASRGLG